MLLSSLSSADIQKLVQLVKEKETLEAKIAQVKSSIDGLAGNERPRGSRGIKRAPRRGRRRLKLKDAILKALQTAGKNGLSVKEIAVNLKANPGSVSVWFYTTGKKVAGLQKIGPGRYALAGTGSTATPAAKSRPQSAKKAPKRKKSAVKKAPLPASPPAPTAK